MLLEGNTILITGGSSGIGLELARQLCTHNTVIITGRDQAKLESAKAQLNGIHVIKSDVNNPQSIAELYVKVEQEFPALNILVNNAGVMRIMNLKENSADLASVTQEIDTNFSGTVRMTIKFLPLLKKQGEAAIVNVSSALAFVPLPASAIYCATKAAVHSFTQSLRVQLKNTNIKVFELAPPATKTPLLSGTLEGIDAMDVVQLAKAAIRGLKRNQMEIRPGQSNLLRNLHRLVPSLTLDKLVKGA